MDREPVIRAVLPAEVADVVALHARARATYYPDGAPDDGTDWGGAWRAAVARPDVLRVGDLPEELRDSKEAEQIRVEVALRVRNEVLKLRKSLGYPDEDPAWKLGLAETWARDPKDTKKSPVDGSAEKPST